MTKEIVGIDQREPEMEDDTKRILRITGLATAVVVVVGTVGALLVKDQIVRQRRNLFNPLALRRMAALEHMARQDPSVDHINLLRDYVAWEPRKLLRNRAEAIVDRMEKKALGRVAVIGDPAA